MCLCARLDASHAPTAANRMAAWGLRAAIGRLTRERSVNAAEARGDEQPSGKFGNLLILMHRSRETTPTGFVVNSCSR